jgi:hypothetical protein
VQGFHCKGESRSIGIPGVIWGGGGCAANFVAWNQLVRCIAGSFI